jgi:hypothetical protein
MNDIEDGRRTEIWFCGCFLCTQARKEDSCLKQHAPGTASRRLKRLTSYLIG